MAATLDELYQLRYSNAMLRNAVVAAVALVALEVVAEDPATPDHTLRLEWANRALEQTTGVAEGMLWAIAANDGIGQAALNGKPTDDLVLETVRGSLKTFAVDVQRKGV